MDYPPIIISRPAKSLQRDNGLSFVGEINFSGGFLIEGVGSALPFYHHLVAIANRDLSESVSANLGQRGW